MKLPAMLDKWVRLLDKQNRDCSSCSVDAGCRPCIRSLTTRLPCHPEHFEIHSEEGVMMMMMMKKKMKKKNKKKKKMMMMMMMMMMMLMIMVVIPDHTHLGI